MFLISTETSGKHIEKASHHLNGKFGLGSYSDEGLESCNKLLRKIRISLSRKATKESNQTDCMWQLWYRSDAEVNQIQQDSLSTCRHCILEDMALDTFHQKQLQIMIMNHFSIQIEQLIIVLLQRPLKLSMSESSNFYVAK